jgi:hypothetical protein
MDNVENDSMNGKLLLHRDAAVVVAVMMKEAAGNNTISDMQLTLQSKYSWMNGYWYLYE